MKKKTWWDAVCDASKSKEPIIDASVLNDTQYRFYQCLRNDPDNGHPPAIFSMTTEEQQMYICFMTAFHNQL